MIYGSRVFDGGGSRCWMLDAGSGIEWPGRSCKCCRGETGVPGFPAIIPSNGIGRVECREPHIRRDYALYAKYAKYAHYATWTATCGRARRKKIGTPSAEHRAGLAIYLLGGG